MIYNVHAGHNADGKIAGGAVGIIKESIEARKVKNEVIRQLKLLGNTVYDCTVDNATSQRANLREIVSKCNQHKVDADVAIHFNSGANDELGNGLTTGTEVLIYSSTSKVKAVAERICENIASLGFKNRGVKVRPNLYVLKNTISPALIVECCFVDDADDVKLYDAKKTAAAIVKGLTGQTADESEVQPKEYRIKVTVDALNIRAGAGTNYKIIGTIRDKGVYTIADTLNGWGKLKSGAGWISLTYTSRL